MTRLLFLALLVGCGGATGKPVKSRPAPTEADACERMCALYDECHLAPRKCGEACVAEQSRYRSGVHPALASCLENELAGCEHREMTERRQIVSICFAAVLEAYSKDAHVLDGLTTSICKRVHKCEPEADPNCEARLKAQFNESPQNRLLSLAKPELLAKIGACIENTTCDDEDPIETCSHD